MKRMEMKRKLSRIKKYVIGVVVVVLFFATGLESVGAQDRT
jgi:hypothetical protein